MNFDLVLAALIFAFLISADVFFGAMMIKEKDAQTKILSASAFFLLTFLLFLITFVLVESL